MRSGCIVSNILNIAELLRRDYKGSGDAQTILPFTLPRKPDCMLKSIKQKVLEEFARKNDSGSAFMPF